MPLISSLGIMNAINFGLASSTVPANPDMLVMVGGTSKINLQLWSNDTGFGTLFSPTGAPTTAFTDGVSTYSTTSSKACAFGASASPYIYAYPISNSGFGTKYANPASLPTTSTYNTRFTTSGNYLLSASNSGYMQGYNFSSSGFGTKLTNSASDPNFGSSYNSNSICISPNNNYVLVGYQKASTFSLSAFPFTSGSFGTQITNPTYYAGESLSAIIFNNTQSKVLIGAISNSSTGNTNRFQMYDWSGSFGTLTSVGPSIINQVADLYCMAFNKDNTVIFIGGTTTGGLKGIQAFNWTANNIGTAFANPVGSSNLSTVVSISVTSAGIILSGGGTYDRAAIRFTTGSGFGAYYTQPSKIIDGGNTLASSLASGNPLI